MNIEFRRGEGENVKKSCCDATEDRPGPVDLMEFISVIVKRLVVKSFPPYPMIFPVSCNQSRTECTSWVHA